MRIAVLACLLLLGAPSVAHAQSRVVVGFEHPIGEAARSALLERVGADHERLLAHLRASVARVPKAGREAILRRLRELPAVAFAELDRRVGLGRPMIGARVRISRTPDDDGFHYQYALYQSDDDHNGYVDDYYGVDLVRGHGSGVDHNGHGTHVAGIIGAGGDNDRGVSGVCWKTQIVPIRFMDADGNGNTSNAAEGIAYAVNVGAHVINASYAATQATDIERRAIAYANDHGTVLVVAAGNDGKSEPTYPAAYPDENIIAVAATTDHDRLASFSDYSRTEVDLAAPGDDIVSTWDDGDYREASGTSMAAPFVSASAAMLRAQSSPSVSRMRSLLLDHVDKVSSLASKVASGGRLNIRRSLDAS
jgi:subtilisin family serine protease